MEELIKFYADAPDGIKNKLLQYRVKDLSHSLDLLQRFSKKGWKIRRAYHHLKSGKEIVIKKELLNFNNEL